MSRVESDTRHQQATPVERHAVKRKHKNAKKKALRRAEGSHPSVLSQNPLATFSDPIYIREQWLCQRGSRYAKELTELRNKRRWVQGQLDNKNIDGSTARDLLKLYDKTYAGKAQGKRPRVEDMSGCAKFANQNLEYAVEHGLGVFGNPKVDQSQGPMSTFGPVSQYVEDMDGIAVKDEEGEEWNEFSRAKKEEEEEERGGFSSDREESICQKGSVRQITPMSMT